MRKLTRKWGLKKDKMNLKDKNIVLVVVDTLSAHNMSLYGHDRETDPFLKDLAENNAYFQKAYSTAPWTIPSHASLFSGKLPSEIGTNSENLNFDEYSFVEELQNTHRTIGLSNNGLVAPEFGFGKGFDDFLYGNTIYFQQKNMKVMKRAEELIDSKKIGIDTFPELLTTALTEKDVNSFVEGFNFLKNKLLSDQYDFDTNLSIEDSGANSTNKLVKEKLEEEPFFLFINYMEPHLPYNPPESLDYPWIDNIGNLKNIFEEFYNEKSMNVEVDKRYHEPLRKLYDAEIRYIDSRIEELHDYIQSEFDDTIFIIIGDHGEMIGHEGIVEHHFGIWERLIRVPLIIAGEEIENQVIEQPVSLKEINGLLKGEVGIEELSKEQVRSEYEGAKGFKIRIGNRSLSSMSKKEQDLVRNKSRSLVKEDKAVIRNSHRDDQFLQIYPFLESKEIDAEKAADLMKKVSSFDSLGDIDI
jgi:hypothetical protein